MRRIGFAIVPLVLSFASSSAQAQPYVYVANRLADNVSVINAATNLVIGTIPVSGGPSGVAITPDATRAYVSLSATGRVAVIDTASRTVLNTVVVGNSPNEIAITPDGSRAYVVNAGSGNISVITTATGQVSTVLPISAADIKIDNKGFAYIANISSNTVSVLDTTANQNTVVATVSLSYPPKYLAINSSGTRVGVTMSVNGNRDSVAILQTGSNTLLGTLAVKGALGIAVSRDGSRAYVLTSSDSVKVVSTATYSVTSSISVSAGSELIAITADEKRAYVPGADARAVSVIDLAAGNVIGAVSAGNGAKGVAITTPSWNPAVSCAPVVVTLRQILGTQQNANGGALQQGGYPYTVPDKTSLSPPCTVNGGPTFVQLNNLLVASGSQVIYSDGDYTFDLVDDNDPNTNIYMKTIHPEDNGEWQAAGIDPALKITAGLPRTLVAGQRIDVQGFVYWDPGHVTEAWHSYSGWEIHPLAAWRINPSSPPVSTLPPLNVIVGFDKTGTITAIQSNLITFRSDDNITYYIKVPAGTPLYDSQGAPSIKLTDMSVNDRIIVTGKFGYNSVELGYIEDLALASYLSGTITSISASQVSVRSTTLVASGATYTAAITSSAIFYDKNGVRIAASAMKTGDSVYVSGLIRGLTVTLGYIKDFSYPP